MTVVGHGPTAYSDVRLNTCVNGASNILFDFSNESRLRRFRIACISRNRKPRVHRIGARNRANCVVNIARMTYALPEVTAGNRVAWAT